MNVAAPEVTFPSVPLPPTLASCSVDGAAATLDWLLRWEAPVTVAGQVHTGRPVSEVLRAVAHDPARFGVGAGDAEGALQRFLAQAAQALEAAGGDAAWLQRELTR